MTTFGSSAPAARSVRALRLHPREDRRASARRFGAGSRPHLKGAAMSVGAGVNERLAALTAAGTSVWLDQIRRSLITAGELARLERELSLRGVTSNPAIFEKAILGSTDYDEQIAELAARGMAAREIYDEIAILDVQLACDVLRPVWDEADHADGFVSLEVEPAFAHDTDATLKQAHEYWERVEPPQPDDQDPGHRGRRAGHRGRDRRRDQRERDAAVLGRVVQRHRGGLRARHGAAPRGRRVARRALRRQLLRLARGHRGGQAPRRLRPRGRCAASRRSPTLARPTSASRRSSAASASPRCATPARRSSGRCGPRPA